MIWESATLKMSLSTLSTSLEEKAKRRSAEWQQHLIAWKRMSEALIA